MTAETSSSPSAAVAVVDPAFSDAERYALAAFLAGYRGVTRDAYALDLRQFIAWCDDRAFACSPSVELISSATPAISKSAAALGRQSPDGSALWLASTATPKRKACSSGRRRRMCAGPASTMSRTPPGWTATRSARCSSPPAWHQPASTRSCRCWPSTGCGSPKPSERTSRPSASNAAIAPLPCCAREARSSPSRSHHAPPERSTWPSASASKDRSSSEGNGERLDRHAAGRIVRRLARRAGINKPVGPHTLRHAFITAAFDADVPLRDVQEAASHADPRTTMRYDRARASLDRHATYIVAAFLAGAAR